MKKLIARSSYIKRIYNKIYKLYTHIIRNDDSISLEDRILNMVVLAGAIFCFFGGITGVYFQANILFNIFLFIVGCVLILAMVYSVKTQKTKHIYFIGVYFISYVLLPIVWIMGGGIRTSIPLIVIFQAILLGCFTTKGKRKYHIFSFIAMFGTLILVEDLAPDLFISTMTRNGIFIDFTITFVLVIVLSFMIVRNITKEYLHILERLNKANKKNVMLVESSEQAYLNAQIKPHFLYNALNTIADCCLADGKEAERLIVELSTYLRSTLDFENLNNLVSLSRELELVRAYIEIEKARFEELKIKIDIEPNNYIMLPSMTIQPLVENAIKHGIRNDFDAGEICISVQRLNDGIRIVVSDNGIGIEAEIQKRLLVKDSVQKGVGLFNINRRLESMYGKGLQIESKKDVGTTVSFVVTNQLDIGV